MQRCYVLFRKMKTRQYVHKKAMERFTAASESTSRSRAQY